MNILIIGGGGLIGQKLARALAQNGTLRGTPITQLTLADINDPAPVDAPFPVATARCDIADPASVAATVPTTVPLAEFSSSEYVSVGVLDVKLPPAPTLSTVMFSPRTSSTTTPSVDRELNFQLAIIPASSNGRSLAKLVEISLSERTSLNTRTSCSTPEKC